ncbi:MAG: MBL fold metallo-hydrolase [bacterium]
MRIHLLGTSAGTPDPHRAPTAILVEGEGPALLIDAGDGVARALARPEFADIMIRSIILTHNHADHVSGLPFLFQGWKGSGGRREPVEIIAPGNLGSAFERWLSALRMAPERLPFTLEFRSLDAGAVVTASNHRMEAWTTDHFNGDGTGDRCFGLTLKLPDGDWVFSSDLGSLDPLRRHLHGVAGLIVEATHVDPVQAVRIAKECAVQRIILTHVPPESDVHPIEGAVWAEDGMILETGNSGEAQDD